MKRKAFYIIFVAVCLLICIIPSAGMFFDISDEPIGNEQQTEFPVLKTEEGKFNTNFLTELGDYFSTHYALRPQIVALDAEIQSNIFNVSNIESVVVGKNDWLYYSSTLNDYLGKNTLSEREIFCVTNNLKITQDYLEKQNINFLFTVAPNKNTLYPENMPYYYSVKESNTRNLDNLAKALEGNVNYCDLLTPLKESDEVLYLKGDSHWNNKGALLAYNTLLDSLGKEHNDYSDAQAVRAKNFNGDLVKMLYPEEVKPEFNIDYNINPVYEYITPTKSVEEAMINTKNSIADGSLYMYRDSFGNALLPYFANAYDNAYFTKAFPINLALETCIQKSDTVIFEIVERNINWFAESPPVLPAVSMSVPEDVEAFDGKVEVSAAEATVNMQYVCISGSAESKALSKDSKFIIQVEDSNGNKNSYEAFTTANDTTEYGFCAYIPKEVFTNDNINVNIIIENDGNYLASEMTNAKIQKAEF